MVEISHPQEWIIGEITFLGHIWILREGWKMILSLSKRQLFRGYGYVKLGVGMIHNCFVNF